MKRLVWALAGLGAGLTTGCGAPPVAPPRTGQVQVQILAFNDFHGHLEPPQGSAGKIRVGPNSQGSPQLAKPERGETNPQKDQVDAGGVEYLATHVLERLATNPHTAVVAAGDLVGGSPLLSALFHDEPTIEALDLLGLQIAAVGNHEFDEGFEELLRLQNGGCHPKDGCADGTPFEGARFRYLAANVVDGEGNTLLPGHIVRVFDGVRVAFIGLALEGVPDVTLASAVKGLTFLDEIETINGRVKALKAEGIEAIVVIIHEGAETAGGFNECVGASGPLVDIVQGLDPAVDVVVSGHTHQAYNCKINGKIVTSGAHAGRILTDIDLTIDRASGEVLAATAENLVVTRTVVPAANLTALIQRYRAVAAPLANRVVGKVMGDLSKIPNEAGESAMGNVIADAQLAATRAVGAQIAFMNPGGIRSDLSAGQLSGSEGLGEVTYGEAFTVQPFNNLLVTMTLTGAQIEGLLEAQWREGKERILSVSSGFQYTWDAAKPMGERVDPTSITFEGKPLDPAGTYRVTVNSYMADGGDAFTMLTEGTERVTGGVDVDALEAYLKANSPLAVPKRDRIQRR